jgi:hypothetical protein
MNVDRFGNPHAPSLPYARRDILAGTEDDFRKLQLAWSLIREKGPCNVFNRPLTLPSPRNGPIGRVGWLSVVACEPDLMNSCHSDQPIGQANSCGHRLHGADSSRSLR